MWEPHTLFPDWTARRAVIGADTWCVLGRLRSGVSLETARAEMRAVAAGMDEQMPIIERNRGIRITALSDYAVGNKPKAALWMLGAVALCVLLIAAANVASLLLARAVARTRELGIRTALGASRFRIARQLLVESSCLAGFSGICGLLLANAAMPAVRTVAVGDLARLAQVTLDARALVWATMLTFTLAAVLGLTPILTGRQTPRLRIHRALVVAEFAAAILLLMSAELLARSWHFLQRVDPGFRADSVYTMNVRPPVGMAAPQRRDFHTRLLKEISAKHGVSHAGFLSDLFIDNYPEKNVTVDGGRVPVRLQYRRDEAGGDAFQALGTRLLRGRFFSVYDRQDSPRVAIVNESMARRLWGASNPVGRKFRPGDGPWFTVVGVVADMRRQGIEFEPIPQMFEAITHTPSGGGVLILRTSAAHDASRAIQTAVRAG